MKKGLVTLVGAGPGDPDLLTVGALKALEQAEIVVYDRLVSPEIMDLIPPRAERIDVGKTSGNHPVPQHEINMILLGQALSGKNVVRLKGGDPFVFGRGGEELELLQQSGVPFRVIPGVTSPIAAAAYAGIPVTHRDYSSSLHILSGTTQSGVPFNYNSLARLGGTLLFLMPVANAAEIIAGLLAAGMPPDTPCAVIENGTRPEQRKLLAPLGDLLREMQAAAIHSPALLAVGSVCTLSDRLDWFSALPLKGRRILVTKPKATSRRLADGLRALGASVHAVPAIRTEPIEFELPDFKSYDWIAFTSASGVDGLFCELFAAGMDARALAGLKAAVVGSATGEALAAHGLRADYLPEKHHGEALAAGLSAAGGRILAVRGRREPNALCEALDAAGAEYDALTVYDTVDEPAERVDPQEYDLVTFTSASCVDAFSRCLVPGAPLVGLRAVCIGELTAARARALGLAVTVSRDASIDAMIQCIKEMF